ncbi:MAG: hypothetical protein KF678_00855 [Phycisphaeraceae bacterium]|nr:hypothetical protein [Phycisphaeraceae bacterium]
MTPQASTSGEVPAGAGRGDAAAPPGFDLWRFAARVVRGRVRVVVALCCLGAAAGGCAGLMLGKRLYTATGLVRIASALPAVLRETDQNRPMANFDGFLQAQREVMSGRDVLDSALQQDEWSGLSKRGKAPRPEELAAGLKVETRPRSDFLQVKLTHKDPLIAATGVRTIIEAYQTVFTREQDRVERSRTEALEHRRAALNNDLARLESQIAEASRGRTLTEIDPLCAEVAERIKKLRGALTDVQVAIAGGPELYPKVWESVDQRAGTGPSNDPAAWYSAQLVQLERELFRATSAGLLQQHPTVIRLENAIEACRQRLASLPQSSSPSTTPIQAATVVPKLLLEREAGLKELLVTAQNEMRLLASERENVKRLDEQAGVLRQQLADTTARLDALATEASMGGRLMVVSSGNRPMTALVDNRAKMAAAGMVVGGLAPLSLLVLAGLVRRTYRSGEELAEDLAGHAPFVAVLPDVTGPGAIGQMAARCVHDIRARLQPQVRGEARVYLVASASPDEGKGALAMGLGFSFAAAGIRTIIIDGDLTSRGVSVAFGAGDSIGLTEAMAGQEPFIQRIRSGPSLLASGLSTSRDACMLDAAALRRVLATLRQKFDVILIVGDPILTGITASVIAPQSDGVILAVANGQQPGHVRQAVRQLEMLGTSLSAAVFNKADPSELPIDVKAREAAEKTRKRAWPPKVRELGPLVANVLSSLSHTREEDIELVSGNMELARSDRSNPAISGEESHGAHDRRSRDAA